MQPKTGFALAIFTCSSLLAWGAVSPSPAHAQCVQADVSVQYNISGSRQPTDRENDVVMESDRGCTGNTSVTTGVQGNVGGDRPVVQRRRVRQRQEGGSGSGSTVQIESNVGIDVYNPADNFQYRDR